MSIVMALIQVSLLNTLSLSLSSSQKFVILFKKQYVYFQAVVRIRTVLTAHSTAPQIVKQEHATQ